MTRVDFYLLNEPGQAHRDHALCKLVHKAFGLGHRVYVLTGTEDEARRLDHLLWTFSAGSFIPHELSSECESPAKVPVLVGTGSPPGNFDDVLITTSPETPECFSRFTRVAEIVGGDEADKQQARNRYRFYRDRGYALQTHNL